MASCRWYAAWGGAIHWMPGVEELSAQRVAGGLRRFERRAAGCRQLGDRGRVRADGVVDDLSRRTPCRTPRAARGSRSSTPRWQSGRLRSAQFKAEVFGFAESPYAVRGRRSTARAGEYVFQHLGIPSRRIGPPRRVASSGDRARINATTNHRLPDCFRPYCRKAGNFQGASLSRTHKAKQERYP